MEIHLAPPIVQEGQQLTELRQKVREFIRAGIADATLVPTINSWLGGWNEEFSRSLAAEGWLGMTIPVEFGGRGSTFLQRFVVTQELLAAGAPVSAHWVADRQIGPSLLKFGTDYQKQKLLPGIANGDIFFGIGMSEPDAGSDLASVRTKGVQVEGGWKISGSKVWTSGAHASNYFFALARTAPVDTDHRHAGLSQFIIDLHSPGVDVRPIVSLNGHHHFNEVFLDDVFVPDDMVLGTIGEGWNQVTSELAYERSGPERFLSTLPMLNELLLATRRGDLAPDPELGRYFARIMGLHQVSVSIADSLSRGEEVGTSASIVKVLGTTTEGDIAEFATTVPGAAEGDASLDTLRALGDEALLERAGFTLRGGTNEVLRGVIARGLGLR
ncbi:MAG: acyl-CoA dehydrogenase [Microbacteriaceae bacterium]|nr:acyl-CoA dehydrogenase [Microbacteriaceae bacterium]